MCVLLFLVKQKTAYEMRISDWSSAVCSSDLRVANRVDNALRDPPVQLTLAPRALPVGDIVKNQKQKGGFVLRSVDLARIQNKAAMRSAERRVGKACVRTCRSRWAADH